MECGLESGMVVVRVGPNEVDDFAVAVGRLLVVASGLIDHAETIPPVVHTREAFEQIVGRLFGLVYFVCAGGEPFGDFRGDGADLTLWHRCGGRELALGGLVFFKAAALVFLATAARAGIIASDFGHFDVSLDKDDLPCTERCWQMPDSTNCFSHSIVILRRPRVRLAAHAAAAYCTRRGFGASRAAGLLGSVRPTISG